MSETDGIQFIAISTIIFIQDISIYIFNTELTEQFGIALFQVFFNRFYSSHRSVEFFQFWVLIFEVLLHSHQVLMWTELDQVCEQRFISKKELTFTLW